MTSMILAALIALGVRLAFNDVDVKTMGSDEVWMKQRARLFARGASYRAAIEDFLADHRQWATASPVRFGYLYPLSLAVRYLDHKPLFEARVFRVMTTLSALGGVAVVALTGAIAHALAGPEVALTAMSISTLSPLLLHLGRRALLDTIVAALTLGTLLALITGHPLVAAALIFVNMSVKETAPMAVPALVLAKWAAVGLEPIDALVFTVPFVVWALVFCALARSFVLLWHVFRTIADIGEYPYGINHQSGPVHRLALDLFMLSPLAFLAASQAWSTPGALFALAMIVTNGVKASAKNVRMIAAADAGMRVAAATVLVSLPGILWPLAALAMIAADAWTFRTVFVVGEVYDPVHDQMGRALKMAPTAHGNRVQTSLKRATGGVSLSVPALDGERKA